MENNKGKLTSWKLISQLFGTGHTDEEVLRICITHGFAKPLLKIQIFLWKRPYLTMFLYFIMLIAIVLAIDFALEFLEIDIIKFV